MEYAVYYSTLVRNYALKRKEGLLINEFPKRIFEAENFCDAVKLTHEISTPDNVSMIGVLIVNPLEEPFYTVIPSELRELQDIVGGRIEYTYIPDLPGVDLICFEEGKLQKCPLNRGLYANNVLFDIVAGSIIIAASDSEGNTVGLSEDMIQPAFDYFEKPEIFFFDREEKDIKVIKCSVEIAKMMRNNKISIIS